MANETVINAEVARMYASPDYQELIARLAVERAVRAAQTAQQAGEKAAAAVGVGSA